MMTGDINDMKARVWDLLPRGWFADNNAPASNPTMDALVTGCAWAWSWCYALYAFALLECRLATATVWLELIAYDFFGASLARFSGQSDDSYRNRIRINLFRERGTRPAMAKVLHDLTGRWPTIVEPALPQDCGGLGISIGLGAAGAVGSLSMPYQAFVTAYRPATNGPANWPGIKTSFFGLGAGGLVDSTQLSPLVSDADIISAVEAVKPYGVTVWMRISN